MSDDLTIRLDKLSRGEHDDLSIGEEAAAELTRLRERNAELEKVIAWANNSLFGSHGFFLSINDGPDNEHHLDEAIENLKSQGQNYFAHILSLEATVMELREAL